jgi:hypothetical protein
MDVVLRITYGEAGLAVEGETHNRWSGRFRFQQHDGTPGEVLIEGSAVAAGAEVDCRPGPLWWSYRMDAGPCGFAALEDLVRLPFPHPEGLPAVCVQAGERVIAPGDGAWTQRLVFWGEFETHGNIRVARGCLAPLPEQLDGIRQIERYLATMFGFHPFPDGVSFLFPVLPEVGPGGFRGSGLAGRGATAILLPRDCDRMDRSGFYWLAAHEIAHWWIGVSVRFAKDLHWLLEGLAAWYAVRAVRACGYAEAGWHEKMLALAQKHRGDPMQRGLLAALSLDESLKERGGLHPALTGLLRDCHNRNRPVSAHDLNFSGPCQFPSNDIPW